MPAAKGSSRPIKDVDGNGVLYHYLEKELQRRDVFMFQMLTARLVSDLGVWLHPHVYDQLPLLLPHVIRDESARSRRGEIEMWASPTPEGWLRDDNSLVKEAVKSLPIKAPTARSFYAGRRIGRAAGWIAAHVWQHRRDGLRTSRHPDTNTFVPNIVWLPKAVAQLTDRPGAFVQRFTQALAISIYKSRPVDPKLLPFVDAAWAELTPPPESEIPPQAVPAESDLSFFVPSVSWIEGRRQIVRNAEAGLRAAAAGHAVPTGRPSRYFAGLGALDPRATAVVRTRLAEYVAALGTSP